VINPIKHLTDYQRINVPPLIYSYNQPDLKHWLQSLSIHLNAESSDKRFDFPEKLATGYAQVHLVEPGFSYRLVNYKLNADFEYKCEPATDINLVIYFYQINSSDEIFFEVGENLIESIENYRGIIMTNSQVKQKLSLKKGTEVLGLTVQLTDQWLIENIQPSNQKYYDLLKQNNFIQDVLTAKHRKILGDIFNHEESGMPELFINSRIMRLLESFLENILKRNMLEPRLSISSGDFKSILKIESLLLENYNEEFPKIERLARIALMSESKLKKIYKHAFGMGLYEYYQKNRMHKAKELLNSGVYSVSQVGAMLGYHNLSNFSASFKKEFNQLPKDHQQLV
jgi:AraC-like DNA-binding protein